MDLAKFAKVHNPIHIATDLIYVCFFFAQKMKVYMNFTISLHGRWHHVSNEAQEQQINPTDKELQQLLHFMWTFFSPYGNKHWNTEM